MAPRSDFIARMMTNRWKAAFSVVSLPTVVHFVFLKVTGIPIEYGIRGIIPTAIEIFSVSATFAALSSVLLFFLRTIALALLVIWLWLRLEIRRIRQGIIPRDQDVLRLKIRSQNMLERRFRRHSMAALAPLTTIIGSGWYLGADLILLSIVTLVFVAILLSVWLSMQLERSRTSSLIEMATDIFSLTNLMAVLRSTFALSAALASLAVFLALSMRERVFESPSQLIVFSNERSECLNLAMDAGNYFVFVNPANGQITILPNENFLKIIANNLECSPQDSANS